jgi:hypothetical protein
VYDADTVLQAIDEYTSLVLVATGGAMIGNAIWFFEAFRNARRDRTYAMPVFCTMYWLVHDASYSAHADTWFNDYDHWFPQLFWVGLTVTTICDAAFTWLILRHGREETALDINERLWPIAVCGLIGASLAAWLMIKNVIDDPLYIITTGLAMLSFPVFGLARILRNGDPRGQSVRMWQGYTLCAICWFTVTTTCFGSDLQNSRWIFVGIVSVIGGLFGIYLIRRMESTTDFLVQ